MATSPEQLAKERVARQKACYKMEIPDKVPLWGIGGDLIPAYSGMTQGVFNHDYDKATEAIKKYNADFQFDTPVAAFTGLASVFGFTLVDQPELAVKSSFLTGQIHKVLNDKYLKFPGNEIGENSTPQFIGGSFMEADEYDQLAEDPLHFMAQTIQPRVVEGLDNPKRAMEIWTAFGVEVEKLQNARVKLAPSLAEQGYGFFPFGFTQAPLDVIADYLRGVTNTVLDTRRHPEKLKRACEALVDPLVKLGLAFKKTIGAEVVFIPLHMNEYLSPTLYNEFYWPTLKEVILRLLDEGVQSRVFFEGHHDHHLESILELPRGWGIAHFEKTDIVRAKEVLKDNCSIAGGLPISMVINGTPESIDAFIKDLFDKVKPGGGFILAPSISTAPVGTPYENIHAVIQAVEKYGYY
jgi:hypothetical protein